MKRFLAFALIIGSSITLLLIIQFVISERDHWTYTYSEISCGNCSQDGIVSNYEERAAIYSMDEGEIELFWFLNFLLSSMGITYVILTKFGKLNKEPQVLESLDKENEIIRKQIEKRELLAKLENLEKK
jgi:hypothetical protein